MPRLLMSGLVVAFLISAAFVHAADWPEFRGPTGQGHADAKLPTEWSDSKNVVWKQAIPGLGWSSPVIGGKRVYLTTAVPNEQRGHSLRVLALDAESGKMVWSTEVFERPASAPRGHNKNSQASPTPILAGDRLYVHFGHLGTACLDTSGKVIWKQPDLKYNPVHGNGGSPALVDGRLIYACDGGDKQFVVALDATSGKVLWKTDRKCDAFKPFSFCTPLTIDVKGKKQVVLPGVDAVCSYDPESGKEIWRVRYKGYSVIPRPVFGHGLVFVCTGYDPPASLLAIRPDGTGDVTATHIAWSTKKGVPLAPSPLLVGDELYIVSDNGQASCMDAKTGNVHWSERVTGTGFSASPLAAGGRIYFQSEDGKTTVVQAGTMFKFVGRSDIGERTLASYGVSGSALFLRTEAYLYRIEEKQ